MVSSAVALRERSFWVTAMGGRVDHAVSQADVAAGVRGDGWSFAALCGDRFLPAPMIAEPAPACLRCVRFLRARATLRSAEERLNALPKQRRDRIARRFLAMALAKAPVVSPHSPQSAPPGEATGRHARRNSDAESSNSEFRRVSTVGRHVRRDVEAGDSVA